MHPLTDPFFNQLAYLFTGLSVVLTFAFFAAGKQRARRHPEEMAGYRVIATLFGVQGLLFAYLALGHWLGFLPHFFDIFPPPGPNGFTVAFWCAYGAMLLGIFTWVQAFGGAQYLATSLNALPRVRDNQLTAFKVRVLVTLMILGSLGGVALMSSPQFADQFRKAAPAR